MSTPPTSITPLDRMAAEWACERLVRHFAQLNDNQDHDGIAALFVEDASFARPLTPDQPLLGREAIRAMFRDRPQRLARHVMTTSVIDLLSPTEAQGRTYLTYVSNADAKAPQPAQAEASLMYGHFDDQFVLTAEGWRFKARRGAVVLKT